MTQFGNNLPNFLIGSGVDTIIGLADADSLVGSTSGRNVLFGNQGNDSLISQAGGDTIYGGQGNDIIRSRGGSLLYGERGNDTIVGEVASGGVIGGASASGGDTMYGGDGDDSLVANSVGPSALFGNTGNDVLVAGNRTDSLFGGQGNDTLTSTVGGLLYGDRGNDNIVLSGSGAAGATVYGGDGDDAITGGGRTLLFGNQGNDTITAGAGDSVYGGSGADVLTAAGSGAFISGDLGNDILNNGGANNTLQGGEGDDSITFVAGAAFSRAEGGGGKNFLQVLAAAGSGNLLIAGSLGDTLVAGGANSVQGGVGDDSLVSLGSQATLIGGAGRDTFNVLAGGNIADYNPGEGDTILSGTTPFTIGGGSVGLFLTGTPNRDTLIGGSANDTLEGLGNNDVLTGGAGADVFLFRGTNFVNVVAPTFTQALAGTATGTVAYRIVFPAIANTVGTVTFAFNGAQFNGTVSSQPGGTTVTGIPFGAALTATFGSSGTGPGAPSVFGIGTTNPITFGSVVVPADFIPRAQTGTNTGWAPAPGYGYATSSVDVITDFESGIDQIRLDAALFIQGTTSVTPNAPGVFAGFSTANDFIGQTANLLYARDTGILYVNPTALLGGTNAGVRGTLSYNPVPVNIGGGFLGTYAPILGAALANQGTSANGTLATLQYQFIPVGTTTVAYGGPTGTSLPLPFVQVLSSSNTAVSNLTFGRDVVIF